MRMGFIKYIVIIAVILLAVIFVPKFLKGNEMTFVLAAASQAKDYISTGTSWTISKVYPNLNGEAQKRGGIIQNIENGINNIQDGINQEKNKILENISDVSENTKNYFSGIANSILRPGQTVNCSN